MKKLLRPICWFNTGWLTLRMWLAGYPLIPYVDGHYYQERGTVDRRGRRYQVLKCMRCDLVDATSWTNVCKETPSA